MARRGLWLVALHVGMIAAALAVGMLQASGGWQPHRQAWVAGAFIVFGLFNALVAVPGTDLVRSVSVFAACAAIAVPDPIVRTLTAVACWLLWPPAFFLSAWRVAPTQRGDPDNNAAGRQARVTTAAIIAAVAVASIAFRLMNGELRQTAALFIGIPAFMAIVVTLFARPGSAIGVACKAVTVGLLVSLIFLGEGFLCIAMSAPIFYAIAIFVAAMLPHRPADVAPGRGTTTYGLVLIAIVPLSLEGVHDRLSFGREESVTVTKIVAASRDEVARALFESPRFDRTLPAYLRAGFPRPVSTRIERDQNRARWIVHMRGGETRLDGQEPAPGDLVLELVERRPNALAWRVASDTTHMTHFLDWRGSTVEWQAIDAGTTRVSWTVRYRRGLDPAWYFGPWERYAMRLAAGYLIDAVATP